MGVLFSGSETEVAIAGGGPTGLMLAAELALAGVEVVVLERRPGQELEESRARGLHARTLEILDQRGIVERFVDEGQKHPAAMFAATTLDLGDLPTRFAYTLGLWQKHIERILAEWVAELGVPIRYGTEAAGFAQDEDGVDVELADDDSLRARYLVGCDGGRSGIRKVAGIDFPGWEATRSVLIAEVEMAERPEYGLRHGEIGISGIGPGVEGDSVGVVVTERQLESGEPTLDQLREALVAVYGTDYGLHSPTWISRFTDATRQAAAYREGRVLLAGDAAHIHYPAGGQGLQLGVQDAVNLGWKLAQVVKGISPAALLDSYQAERHPPTARALRETMAATVLQRGDARTVALRETLSELAEMDEPRRHLAAQRVGLDIQYDLGEGHPLLGRRMPDLDLATADGPRRVYGLLHRARPALLNLGEPGAVDVGPWADRVQLLDAEYAGDWELPVLGEVAAPAAVLIRPDGHVAWVGEGSDHGLGEVLATWFGPRIASAGRLPGPARHPGRGVERRLRVGIDVFAQRRQRRVAVGAAPDQGVRIDGRRVPHRDPAQVVAGRPQVLRAGADQGRQRRRVGDLGEQRIVAEMGADDVDLEPELGGELVVEVAPLGLGSHPRHPDPVPGELGRRHRGGAGERMARPDQQLVLVIDHPSRAESLR